MRPPHRHERHSNKKVFLLSQHATSVRFNIDLLDCSASLASFFSFSLSVRKDSILIGSAFQQEGSFPNISYLEGENDTCSIYLRLAIERGAYTPADSSHC